MEATLRKTVQQTKAPMLQQLIVDSLSTVDLEKKNGKKTRLLITGIIHITEAWIIYLFYINQLFSEKICQCFNTL